MAHHHLHPATGRIYVLKRQRHVTLGYALLRPPTIPRAAPRPPQAARAVYGSRAGQAHDTSVADAMDIAATCYQNPGAKLSPTSIRAGQSSIHLVVVVMVARNDPDLDIRRTCIVRDRIQESSPGTSRPDAEVPDGPDLGCTKNLRKSARSRQHASMPVTVTHDQKARSGRRDRRDAGADRSVDAQHEEPQSGQNARAS